MPDSRPLVDLRAGLAASLVLPKGTKEHGWAPAEQPMAKALAETINAFGREAETKPSSEAMVAAVRAFWRDPEVRSFNQLKYVCYGLTLPLDADGNRLIDRPPLFKKVLQLVDQRQGQAKPFRRCYQGLLSGYFGFERRADSEKIAGAHWLQLRQFLGARLAAVQKSTTRLSEPPLWLATLLAHPNLLQDKPCTRYAAALRQGDTSVLKNVCTALNIETNSWVWDEAVLAYILELVEEADRPFQGELRTALGMVQADDKSRRLPAAVAQSATAMLVMRYARCQDKPEHPQLRDTCIARIGNPWLDRSAWDGAVRDEEARRMVESWLKRGLIKDFFELLSHDGAADARRLNYWLKWEPHIRDMWFALGGDAQSNRDAEFRSIRERMRGRERRLTGATGGDNAFIMRIRDTFIIEFGLKGTACFVFEKDALPLDLDDREVSLPALRAAGQKLRLIHRGNWELDFDVALRDRIGTATVEAQPVKTVRTPLQVPAVPGFAGSRSAPVPHPRVPSHRAARSPGWEQDIRRAATSEGLMVEDRRFRGGAFWLLTSQPDGVSRQLHGRLLDLGFRLVNGKGFYLENDD